MSGGQNSVTEAEMGAEFQQNRARLVRTFAVCPQSRGSDTVLTASKRPACHGRHPPQLRRTGALELTAVFADAGQDSRNHTAGLVGGKWAVHLPASTVGCNKSDIRRLYRNGETLQWAAGSKAPGGFRGLPGPPGLGAPPSSITVLDIPGWNFPLPLTAQGLELWELQSPCLLASPHAFL